MARADGIQPRMLSLHATASTWPGRAAAGSPPGDERLGTYEALAAPVLWAGPRGLSTGELQRRRSRTLISGSALRAGGGDLRAAKSVVRDT
jgi:hypothetical protein